MPVFSKRAFFVLTLLSAQLVLASDPIPLVLESFDKGLSVNLGSWPVGSKKTVVISITLPDSIAYTPSRIDTDCGCVKVTSEDLGKPKSTFEVVVAISDKGEAGGVDRTTSIYFTETGSKPVRLRLIGTRFGLVEFNTSKLDFSKVSEVVLRGKVSNPKDIVSKVSSLTGLVTISKCQTTDENVELSLSSKDHFGYGLERLKVEFASGASEIHNFVCCYHEEWSVLPRFPTFTRKSESDGKKLRSVFHLIDKSGSSKEIAESDVVFEYIPKAEGDAQNRHANSIPAQLEVISKNKSVLQLTVEFEASGLLEDRLTSSTSTSDCDFKIKFHSKGFFREIPCKLATD